ncbi:hypothetical protein D7V86_09135 [bacterium D16-51]|nr:hypothetical protein D7V96_09875 [bacterium D16-59]RKI60359.1 hypothetical protein D7V86_09135 [bacterium D16-51]
MFHKIVKKVAAVALAMAVAGSAIVGNTASAAKSYNCFLMFADSTWGCQNMKENVANTSVKNKKGTAKYTVTLKKAQATSDGKKAKAKDAKDAAVFCVDIKGILKDHKAKDIKISNVVVKCDGKVVKTAFNKMAQGQLESKQDPGKYRLEIYNQYGEGGTSKHPCAKLTAFKWKKSISVTFSLNIKK